MIGCQTPRFVVFFAAFRPKGLPQLHMCRYVCVSVAQCRQCPQNGRTTTKAATRLGFSRSYAGSELPFSYFQFPASGLPFFLFVIRCQTQRKRQLAFEFSTNTHTNADPQAAHTHTLGHSKKKNRRCRRPRQAVGFDLVVNVLNSVRGLVSTSLSLVKKQRNKIIFDLKNLTKLCFLFMYLFRHILHTTT